MCNLAIFSTSDAKIVRSILSCKNRKIKPKLIITNKPDSDIMEVAKRYNMMYKCFDHREYSNRIAHEKDIIRFLRKEGIELIIFAHYMRLVTKYFVDRFKNKIINVHPSLLPDFKGGNGYKDAFDAGVSKSGCTLHYVDEGLDTGEIILQKTIDISPQDTLHSLQTKVANEGAIALLEALGKIKEGNVMKVIPRDDGSYNAFPTKEGAKAFRGRGRRFI